MSTPSSTPQPSPSQKSTWQRYKVPAIVGTLIAVVAAIGALLSGIGAFGGDGPANADSNNGNGNTNTVGGGSGNGNCIMISNGSNNGQSCITLSAALSDPKISDEQIKQALQKTAAQPAGNGPWQYVVLDTEAYGGLKVRSGPTRNDVQIGSAGNRAILWAECQMTSDFDPDRTLPTGPVWVRIHWPNATPTKEFFNSQPADPVVGWVHRGYAYPAGHDGKIPTCK
jgi:hypothetical protein